MLEDFFQPLMGSVIAEIKNDQIAINNSFIKNLFTYLVQLAVTLL